MDRVKNLAKSLRGWAIRGLNCKQPMYEPAKFCTFCHWMILGDKIRAIDAAAASVLKRVLVESEREQNAPKHPQIHLLIDHVTVADIQADV